MQYQEDIQQQLHFIRDRMAKYANSKRIEGLILKEGDKVYLLRSNIKTKRPSDKLDHKKIGPFKISRKLSDVSYELSLPPTMRIHPIFYIALLEPAPANARLDQNTTIEDNEPGYEVERILDSRNNNQEYLVKWKGYEHSENTWEPIKNLQNCQQALQQYYQTIYQPRNQTNRPLHSP